MIARLRGMPAGRPRDGLVLDVNGVGYLVQATPSALRRADGEELTVETYLHVREDALQLYGFAEAEERELFVHLLASAASGRRSRSRSSPARRRPSCAARSRSRTRRASRRSPASARRPRSASCSS